MYAKFFKAANRRKNAQAASVKTDEQSYSDNSTELKKSSPSQSSNNEVGPEKVCSDYTFSFETVMDNLSEKMENSLRLSKPSVGSMKTNILFLKDKKMSQITKMSLVVLSKTENEEHMEIPPYGSNKIESDTKSIRKIKENVSQSDFHKNSVQGISPQESLGKKSQVVFEEYVTSFMLSAKSENDKKPLKSLHTETDSFVSDSTKMCSGSPELVGTKFCTETLGQTNVMENSLDMSKSKTEGAKMTLIEFRRMKLAQKKKVPVNTNEKDIDRKHMLPTEDRLIQSSLVGNKTILGRPTVVRENRIHGTEQNLGAAKMVSSELRNGNLAGSSNVPPKCVSNRSSDEDHIVQVEPKYVSAESTSENCLQGYETPGTRQKFSPLDQRRDEASGRLDVSSPVVKLGYTTEDINFVDETEVLIPQYDRERMRSSFNKLVQKRNPEVRQITNTLEQPSLFDKLIDSVNDMNYNGGRNPVELLNELKPNTEYHVERSGPPHLPNFKVSVNIDGWNYHGVGKTKKVAKMNTAMIALKGINKKTSVPTDVKSTYTSSNQESGPSTSFSSDQVSVSPTLELNPVLALNNVRKGLIYRCVKQSGPPHLPNFKVCVRVDGKAYFGNGRTKKLAKSNAAEVVLRCISGQANNQKIASVGSKPVSKCISGQKNNRQIASVGSKPVSRYVSGQKNNRRIASVCSKPIKNTSNVTTRTISEDNATVDGKPPFAILNELYPNPEVSWTGRGIDGNASFTITINSRKFTGVGPNKKSAKNNAAIRALQALRGFTPTSWNND